ncbi:AMP-binding protein [Amycolatopsis acidicola]|uniref:AMP-binding protein n=1 Tax=Amycolatopsis acidicola TaxID=2596893 RepID=A0A5N0VNW3_9PSEU|nr:AMP-binding protein [Amycolatopsis acidicola]KAA9166482.1 AMP-binding protein [Amycolatopsis acidicola]
MKNEAAGAVAGLLHTGDSGLWLAIGPGQADRVVLRHGGLALTAGQLELSARRVAGGLARAGIQPGDRVVVVQRNGIELIELLLGCTYAGAVVVPVNWRLAPAELAAVVHDAGPAALIAQEGIGGVPRDLGGVRLRLCLDAGYRSWRDAETPAATPRPAPGGVVAQVYTSGTGGVPKGVQLTAANIGAKVAHVARVWDFTASSVSLLATPLFHIGALSWALVGLHAGATTVVAESVRADVLVRAFRDEGISHAFLVPTLLQRLCESLEAGETLPELRDIVYGAAPITPAEQRRAAGRLGCRLHQLYGLTETTGGITQLDVDADSVSAPESLSVGKPYPWVEVEIRDPESGAPVAPGETGEVWTRSPQNTPGYAGRPDETAALLTPDGWLRTGDGGRLGPQGHLFLTDRIKDMIVTGGENVYPAELERVLREHPGIADAAVVGIPDERWGELVTAVVVPRPGSGLTETEVADFTAGRIAGYKRPRRVVLTQDLPRNATGKVLKRSLRRELAAGQEGVAR